MDKAEIDKHLKERYDADTLAKIMVEHHTNEKGELLAQVWNSPSFKEIWDYNGTETRRGTLKRKAEQLTNEYNFRTHLFQKVYYNTDLTYEDEIKLREDYLSQKNSYVNLRYGLKAALFVGFWPLTYYVSAKIKPIGVALWTGAYFLGLYSYGVNTFTLSQLQSGLNQSALPLA